MAEKGSRKKLWASVAPPHISLPIGKMRFALEGWVTSSGAQCDTPRLAQAASTTDWRGGRDSPARAGDLRRGFWERSAKV